MRGLRLGACRRSGGGWARRPGAELGLGRLDDPVRAQDLVRLRQDAKGPFLAADVGMVLLGLASIRLADLEQRGAGSNTEDGVRVDLNAQIERHEESPTAHRSGS